MRPARPGLRRLAGALALAATLATATACGGGSGGQGGGTAPVAITAPGGAVCDGPAPPERAHPKT
ncbi:MAG TPA: hypothetical protein VM844_01735, partial [Miltoncostaeaceae bacterium]|nr:hypothetical protein [Miltoncostaeaceae bacterium]